MEDKRLKDLEAKLHKLEVELIETKHLASAISKTCSQSSISTVLHTLSVAEIRILVNKRADVMVDCLNMALSRDKVRDVENLLNAGLIKIIDKNGLLMNSCHSNAPRVTRLLLEHGANPNHMEYSSVHRINESVLAVAAQNNRTKVAGELLAGGANPELKDKKGRTAFDCGGDVYKTWYLTYEKLSKSKKMLDEVKEPGRDCEIEVDFK